MDAEIQREGSQPWPLSLQRASIDVSSSQSEKHVAYLGGPDMSVTLVPAAASPGAVLHCEAGRL